MGCVAIVLVSGAASAVQVQPGEVIYDFVDVTNTCYPQDWTFFGNPQTDFGFDGDAEDGTGAFQAADWTTCDLIGGGQCQWVGSGVGLGLFTHPHCTPGGVADVNLDLSLGTGLSFRLRNDISTGFGVLGARLQLQLVDADGTTAVTPRAILANPAVNRMPLLPEDWATVVFPFAGLDWANDNDDAVAGAVPGLDLTHITTIRLLWRRSTGDGLNVFRFDKVTLRGEAVYPWADRDTDGDVDLDDYAFFQVCFGAESLGEDCAALDADADGDVDLADWAVFADCLQGPNYTVDYFAWCY
jgi:hypothetical protein